jgi:hypothetical protein
MLVDCITFTQPTIPFVLHVLHFAVPGFHLFLDSDYSSIPIAPPLPRRRRHAAAPPPHRCLVAVAPRFKIALSPSRCHLYPPSALISFRNQGFRFPTINSLIFQLKMSRFISYLAALSPHSILFFSFIAIVYHSTYCKIISVTRLPMTTTRRCSFME